MCSHFNLSSGYLKSTLTFAQIKFYTYAQSTIHSDQTYHFYSDSQLFSQAVVGGLVVIVAGIVVVVPEIISCKSEKEYNSSFGIAYSE